MFRIRPFVHETPWKPFLLNGPGARFMVLRDIPAELHADDRSWFVRPVDDSKAQPGTVRTGAEIVATARKVMTLRKDEIPGGSLRHDTELMVCPPMRILREWRVWIVADRIVTTSLYKEGARVTYRPEIDDDAEGFARDVVAANPNYAPAYVLDICRTEDGLRLLETNCINAAGFYAADLIKLAAAIEDLGNL